MSLSDYPPIDPKNYERMCHEWTDVILRRESGTWICSPFYAPYRRIWQFKEDLAMQKKLFGRDFPKQLIIHVDFKQKRDLTKEEIHQTIKEAILNQSGTAVDGSLPLVDIIDFILQKEKKVINLFVEGVDVSIRNNNWGAINELNFLAQRNWDTHIILFIETDITHPKILPQFASRTSLCQNLNILPAYTLDDVPYFKKFLSDGWKVEFNSEQEKWIKENCGSNYLLIKEVFRQVKKNPGITFSEIDKIPTLHIKAEAILSNFQEDERAVLYKIAQKITIGKELDHSKNFLLKLGLITEKDGKLEISVPYIKRVIMEENSNSQVRLEDPFLNFTKLERKVLNYLKAHINSIIPREDLAQVIWENDWEEKYSDWAIDQMMHKLREKLEKNNLSYKIVTKKGEGFILLSE